jgi:hypothetical protein
MSQLSQLSQAIIADISERRTTLDELRTRNHRRHVRRRSLAAGSLALALGVVVVVVSVGETATTPTGGAKTQLASYYQAAIDVSNSTLESVGLPATVAVPRRVTSSLSTASTNSVVSYVGAEYCPYCAFQRWALLVALSKFGTFTNLNHEVLSSSSDTYPHLASWSFIGAKYTSKYFRFEPVELNSDKSTSTGRYASLEKMTAPQRVAYDKFDPQAELPFVDFGNHYVTLGASSSPGVLEGLSLSEIGKDLNDPRSPVAQAIDGSANYLVAAFCSLVQSDSPAICSTSATQNAVNDLTRGVGPSQLSPSAATAPIQPATNAPLSDWEKWSEEDHKFMLAVAANYRSPNPACTIMKISVTATRSTKDVFGVPAGVTRWALSFEGKCPPRQNGKGK